MASDDYIAGTIKIGWSISERDLGIDGLERELTSEELRELYDRIEQVLAAALPRRVRVGDVRVVLEILGDDEIEIDEGPVNGWLFALREELEADDAI